jgi:hypothetical protein
MTFKSERLKFAVVVAVALLAPSAAYAVGEVNGRMGGTISEAQTGAPVPGATVTVSSSGLIGGPKTVTTDDMGRYEIVELPPGSYTVEVSYSGVKPIKRRVVVRQGELLPLDIQWSAELAEAEVTVVVEERHMTRPDSTQSGTVITHEQSSKVATQRSYQNIAQQVAGMVDVGQAPGNPSIKGGNIIGNKYLVDGLDISDAVTQTFSANINFDSIASVDVITGGFEAQYNALGGIINVITAGGSDEWHVDSSIYISNDKFSYGSQYGSQLYNGETPLSRIKPAPTQSYQANINVSGPIIKHRLWFQASYEFRYNESSTPAGPPLNLQAAPRRFISHYARLKLTWAPNDKHRLTLSASADPATIDNVSAANGRLPIAQRRQDQGGVFAIFQWDWFVNKDINTQIQAGFQWNNINAGPQGAFGSIDDNGNDAQFSDKNRPANWSFANPQHINLVDNSIWYQGDTESTYDNRYTVQIDPSISLRGKLAGTHDAKIGIQNRYVTSTYDLRRSGGGISYLDNGAGDPRLPDATLERGVCDESLGAAATGCFLKQIASDYSQKYDGYSFGFYAQDRWKPWKRLTILPGIRFDYGFSRSYGTLPGTQDQFAAHLFGVGPRLGAVLDLTGDNKTIFSVWYGRSNEVGTTLPAAYGSATSITELYQWDGQSFSQLFSRSGGSRGYQFDPTASTPPHTDQVQLSLRREIFKNSVASIEYTYKRTANMWDQIEINQLWDPTGTRQLTDPNGTPLYVDNSNPQKIYKITTNHNLIREYQGIDFVAESRPTPNWDFYIAYTLAWLYGSAGEQFGGQINLTNGPLYNPRQTHFWQGFLPEDVRHVLKIRASYTYKGFNAGAFLQYTSGANLTKNFYQYSPDGDFVNYRSPIGTEPGRLNDPRGFTEIRLPDIFTVNLRAQYDLNQLWKGAHHLFLIVDFFNLFNIRPANDINANDLQVSGANPNSLGSNPFGTVTSRVQPFRFQIAIRYLF